MSPVTCAGVFDLAQTLDCGQAFRWQAQEKDVWQGIALGKVLRVSKQQDTLQFHCPQAEFDRLWKPYFDLDADYAAIRHTLSGISPIMRDAAVFAPGIRILRQDPWEALCSFIISQNNNIPRIKGIIERFCRLLGEDLGCGFSFPSAERVAGCSTDDLAPIRSGFRAKYIISAAKSVAAGALDIPALYQMPLPQAREMLMTIQGVGPKVAECVLLYGFHRTDCFPMDVWMKRAMAVLFPDYTPAVFGEYAGIAQQYIFHYSRMNPGLFTEQNIPNK